MTQRNVEDKVGLVSIEKVEDGAVEKKKWPKRKRQADYLREPIRIKANERSVKVNINSFRSRFSTLKRKVSSLQLEHGLLPDFLLMLKNNVQKENVSNPALNAGKYMVKCSGNLEELLKTHGLKYNSSTMVMMANNFDFTEERLDEEGEVKLLPEDIDNRTEDRIELMGKVAINSFRTRYSLSGNISTMNRKTKHHHRANLTRI